MKRLGREGDTTCTCLRAKEPILYVSSALFQARVAIFCAAAEARDGWGAPARTRTRKSFRRDSARFSASMDLWTKRSVDAAGAAKRAQFAEPRKPMVRRHRPNVAFKLKLKLS